MAARLRSTATCARVFFGPTFFARSLAGLIVVLGTAQTGAAQSRPELPRLPDPFAALRESVRMEFTSDFGIAADDAEGRVRALMQWQSNAALAMRWTASAAALGVRAPARSWAGAEAALRGTFGRDWRGWIEPAAIAGAGSGANGAFRITAAAGNGNLTLLFRSAWWDAAGSVRDSLFGSIPATTTAASRYNEAELLAQHRIGRLEVSANAGARFGEQRDATPPWAALELAFPMRGNLDLTLSGGRRPDRPELGQLAGSFALLGLRLRSRPPAADEAPFAPAPPPPFSARPAGGTMWIIEVHRPGARTVELTGDFTGWSPLRMERLRGSADLWRLRISIAPGLHHVALRVDGDSWSVPPGLPVVPDGFGGETGLLELQ
jgi:hypothetical protein